MTNGISTRGSKILVGAIALMIATGATFAGTLISFAPRDGGDNIQPLPPVSGGGGGGGNNILAVDQTWANTGTDFNAGPSWVSGTAPGATDRAIFSGAEVTQ